MRTKRLCAALLCAAAALTLAACGNASAPAGGDAAPTHAVVTPPPDDPEGLTERGGSDEIGFRVLYQGFTAVGLDDAELRSEFDALPGEGFITDEESWYAFCESFCPGIWYFEDFNFTDNCLLYAVSMGAKPSFAVGHGVESVTLGASGVQVNFAGNSGDNGSSVYALNTADTVHYFITLLILDRSQLPSELENVYTA